MSDASQQTTIPARSSVLFALGRLEAQNDAQRSEIASLPGRIAELFTPRLVAIEGTLADHTKQIAILNRSRWFILGAAGTVSTLVTLWEIIRR